MKYKTSVFIGRFQPIHEAHLEIIDQALKISETVIISVGSAHRPKTIKNPWTAQERIEMIKTALLERYNPEVIKERGWKDKPTPTIISRIKFIQVRDHMYNNTRWASETYSKALQVGATQNKETCLIGCFKDKSSWYLNIFPQWSLHPVDKIYNNDNELMNATDIRDEMFETGKIVENSEYIPACTYKEVTAWTHGKTCTTLTEEYKFVQNYKKSWEAAPYAPTFVTSDCVVIKSGHILIIKRKFNPGKGLWALPGGFVDSHETVEESAIRELKEETRIKIDKPVLKRNIIDVKIFDHPERSMRGRTITHAHLIDLGEGPLPEIKAGDDASGAHWIPLADLKNLEDQMFEDHNDIIQHLTSRF
ncbi:bifunctional nicotinamide-nucleotide adenylyltransferase/Nudix hydroxylase [Candidatus Pacearchaeota archaeon]|nr:bifunctional nicotinamide-nucleotide adenylyltransferase/Nudix hydroxylase [Candidatus Pacearchaeota archaeon]